MHHFLIRCDVFLFPFVYSTHIHFIQTVTPILFGTLFGHPRFAKDFANLLIFDAIWHACSW